MTATILDGKAVAERIKAAVKAEVAKRREKPGLAAVIVGENPASRVYVGMKQKACEEAGIYSELHKLPEKATEKELLQLIERLNEDRKIHAILVQLPLPKHINEEKILAAVAVEKDVDGFNPVNAGKLAAGNEEAVPCTPKGIIRLLEEHKFEIGGKNAVVVGRSNIVGRPVAMMLLNRDATVTICHSKTKDLKQHTKNADILIAAVGKPKMITADMVKDGAAVIDVGTTKLGGKLTGDVDFEAVKKKAACITPVPGGVGPMTIAMLLENTIERHNVR
ncbi:bifunctional methylenetetrahydrofolate dehydrogenase/methenyltetrahydrofolate cyclohydrolase FolD [Candidatus Woesearchaeota archaeon]|nr:bifunctional methylenetetrahydrofolate dehydrogenase/methenyltetrahydrofolate cyclohydrolase FolD [Candidatus Woesearchaeota archaeon]